MSEVLVLRRPRPPAIVPPLLSFTAGFIDSFTVLALFGLFVAQVTGSYLAALSGAFRRAPGAHNGSNGWTRNHETRLRIPSEQTIRFHHWTSWGRCCRGLMSAIGTKLPIPNVRSSVANGGKADKICSP